MAEVIANTAYFSGLAFGWASRLEEISKTTDNKGVLKLIEDMKEESKQLAEFAGVDPLE